MGKWTPSGRVIIGGQEFQTEAPIVNFREGPKWDATQETCIITETDPNPFVATSDHPGCKEVSPGKYAAYKADPGLATFTKRYGPRPALRNVPKSNGGYNVPYDIAKTAIRHFMIHHDGCATADMCFSVAQNERGLSVHFLCDNDGIIYQTLDLALEGWHGSELCPTSIGIELCNRGDAAKEPTYYSKHGVNRPVKPCKINNHTIKSYDFMPAQYEALARLSRALLRLLPAMPAEYPQKSPGVPTYDTVGYAELMRFSGFVGHYHLTTNKWDPGPFDFKDFMQKIRGAFCWPAFPRGEATKEKPQPVVPDKASLVKDDAEQLYKLNEQHADGGFFPVGPWGDARLWHGGIHMTGREGAKVFSTFPGRLVAARQGANSPIGSVNFALVRHEMRLADRKLEFYSLYMHLGDELRASEPVDWLAKARTGKDGKPRDLKAGEVWLLDEPIEAGQVVGHIGVVGPGDLSKSQIHVEVFSNADMFDGMRGVPWETVDGTSGGRFCDAQRINDAIDQNKDGVLSRDELKQYFTTGSGSQMYYLVTRHVSEWTAEPSWNEQLRLPKDFRNLKPEAIDALVSDQITPGLWWDDKVAQHARLTPDGVVYHYHPISFVRWLNERLIDAADQAGPQTIDPNKAGEVPAGITDDRDGKGMMSTSVLIVEDKCNDKLTLKELAMGFDAPECK